MLCEHCQKNEATVHFTSIVNHKKTEEHLCQACASEKQQQGGFHPQGFFSGNMFDTDFFNNEFFNNMVYPNGVEKRGAQCSHCGMTYEDFNRTGKFGCAHCYETFDSQIDPLVRRLQGNVDYEGRVPNRGSGVFKTKHEIKRLRQELGKAVAAENFEEAVKLRDQIKYFEDSLQGGEGHAQ